MYSFKKIIILILILILTTSFLGCQTYSNTPKLDQYIEIISLTEVDDNKYEIEYELKEELNKEDVRSMLSIYFSNGTENYPVNDKKGNHKITLTGNHISLIFNGGQRYNEEKRNINMEDM